MCKKYYVLSSQGVRTHYAPYAPRMSTHGVLYNSIIGVHDYIGVHGLRHWTGAMSPKFVDGH